MEGLPALVKHSLHSTFEVLPTSSPSASSATGPRSADPAPAGLSPVLLPLPSVQQPKQKLAKSCWSNLGVSATCCPGDSQTRRRGAPPLHERGTIGEAGWCRGSALRESGRKNRPSIGRTGVGHVGPLSPAPHTHEAFVPSAIVP